MNIQEYISSGIVESYVLGLASNEEQQEFEQLAASHPELRQAKQEFEESLERHALDNAMMPPAALKDKIWSSLQLDGNMVSIDGNAKSTHTVSQPLTPVRSMSFAKLLAAASIILLAGSTLLNFYFYNQYKVSSAKLEDMIASNQQLADNRNLLQAKLQEYQHSFDMIKDTNMAVVAMKGQPVAPQSLTTVYYDKQTRDVYLLVNSLPQPASGKQYQLWAIVNGKPVDAGMLDTASADGLVKMKNIPNAQAFAITLEKTGGSKTPTVPIYVVGKI